VTERYIAALDQGTTSTRCIVYDHHGRLVSVAQREHRQYYPRPGWVEHDPTEIWEIVRRIIPQALADADVEPRQIMALGITNQRETTVVWDRHTGKPAHRAIVWQDNRTAGLLPAIAAELDDEILLARCGLPLATYFSGPKLRWLLDNDRDLRARAESGDLLFGTVDSWLLWNLTGGIDGGVHATDVTNASRTMLMNLETLDWDDELLAGMHVPRRMMPEIRPTNGPFPSTVDPIAGIPITAVIGDQQASLFGQTAFEAGEAKCTFGTGSFVLLNTGKDIVRSQRGLLTTVARKFDGEPAVYALEGSVAVAGALVAWSRDNLGLVKTPAEIETLARTVEDNGGCYIVPAFSGLYSPYWATEARGLVVGLTSYVTKGHIARAVLEATAWQIRDVIDAMKDDSDIAVRSLHVDGGMTADNLLMQLVADILDAPVVRPMMAETVALGAAYAAGLAAGYWPDRAVLRSNWRRAAEWRPSMDPTRRQRELDDWHRAVQLAISWGDGRRETV